MYQFQDLKILKCSLLDEEDCVWEYQFNDKMVLVDYVVVLN